MSGLFCRLHRPMLTYSFNGFYDIYIHSVHFNLYYRHTRIYNSFPHLSERTEERICENINILTLKHVSGHLTSQKFIHRALYTMYLCSRLTHFCRCVFLIYDNKIMTHIRSVNSIFLWYFIHIQTSNVSYISYYANKNAGAVKNRMRKTFQ